MNQDQWNRASMSAYAAGMLAGVLSNDDRFARLAPLVDDEGIITGELHFVLSGWHFQVTVEAMDTDRASE